MVKKAAERRLIKFPFLAIGQSNHPLFSLQKFQMESNHYEMKLIMSIACLFTVFFSPSAISE